LSSQLHTRIERNKSFFCLRDKKEGKIYRWLKGKDSSRYRISTELQIESAAASKKKNLRIQATQIQIAKLNNRSNRK